MASLTALTNGLDCGKVIWSRCNIVKGLVIISWIDTCVLPSQNRSEGRRSELISFRCIDRIFVFLALVFVGVLAIKARSGLGARRSTLIDA